MKMKKVLALVLIVAIVAALCIALTACNTKKETVKFGLITLHDDSSTYDANFINALKEVCDEMGVDYVVVSGVDENEECYQTAADLVDQGCNVIFADSFGHEDYMIQAAREFPNVQFFHATGTQAHTAGLDNFHNAFANIYEGRYLAGVAAGMKLKAMKEANPATPSKVGYIGAFTYAEVISGYTSWFLGVRSIVSDATMDVTFTGSWFDPTAEAAAATKLITGGCALISQHADSYGAPSTCEAAGVPNVTYNLSTKASCPNTYIVGSRINWAVYYKYIIENVQKGKKIGADWTEGLSSGAVELTELNTTVAAAGTQAKLDEVAAAIKDGSLKVFDTSKFTVSGAALTTYLADVDDLKGADGKSTFEKDTEVVLSGAFAESKFRSAPYFDLTIDGITLLDTVF